MWYAGTADAVYQNMDIIEDSDARYIVILAGDHIYKMDYELMIRQHVETKADVTVGCLTVDRPEASAFGCMAVDGNDRITSFLEKPKNPPGLPDDPGKTLVSMGIYVFDWKFLRERLVEDMDDDSSSHDFGNDMIPEIVAKGTAQAHRFEHSCVRSRAGAPAYWRDVGTLDAYWEANMELVMPQPQLDLYDPKWPIWTYQEQLPPAKFIFDDDDRRGMAVDSTVSGGCIISGSKVKKSLLFSNVYVHSFCEIEESVILPGVKINRNCKIRRAIIDRNCEIPEGLEIGYDNKVDKENGFRVSKKGIVLVTRDMLNELAKKLEQQEQDNKRLA